MPPKLNASQDDLELFRSRLENIIDQRHPLVRLARLIDWRVFEERFGKLYAEAAGRPALPTRRKHPVKAAGLLFCWLLGRRGCSDWFCLIILKAGPGRSRLPHLCRDEPLHG